MSIISRAVALLYDQYRATLRHIREVAAGSANPLAYHPRSARLEPLESRVLLSASPYIDHVKINGDTVNDHGGYYTVELDNLSDGFTFEVRAGNAGEDSPAGYNNISMSFGQFTSSSDKWRVSSDSRSGDLSYVEFFGSEAGGGDGYANYVMAESSDTNGWDGSDYLTQEENYLRVHLTPKQYGTFDIFYRSSMSDRESWTQGWTDTPSSSAYRDAIGIPAYRYRITIAEPPEPDLIVQDISVSSPRVAGQSTTITATLKNQGEADADGSIQLKYYVDGEHIGSDSMSFGLDAGDTDTESISYTVPSSGNHDVRVFVDSDYSVRESNESNNSRTETFYWSTPPKPDLVISSLGLSRSSGYAGQEVTVTSVTTNDGDADTGWNQWSKVRYYIGDAPGDLWREIGWGWTPNLQELNGISVGENESDTITWDIDSDLSVGRYYITAVADADDDIDESDETDYRTVLFDVIAAPKPDLIVTQVTDTLSSYTIGDKINAKVTIRNNSTQASADSSKVYYYLGSTTGSTSTGPTTIYDSIQQGSISSLSPGGTDDDIIGNWITGGWTIPSNVAAGDYRVWVKADSSTQVSESNENNNWGSSASFAISEPEQVTSLSFRDASGNPISSIYADQTVYVRADAVGMTGQQVTVWLYEDDGNTVNNIDDDAIRSFNISIGANGYGTASWTAEWQSDDGDDPFNQYYLWYDKPFSINNLYSGSPGEGHFLIRPLLENEISGKATQTIEQEPVSIRRVDDLSAAIDPSIADTWVLVHGWNSTPTVFDDILTGLKLDRYSDLVDQILVIDWSVPAEEPRIPTEAEGWILPVAEWASAVLTGIGATSSSFNFIGHSFGSYISYETSRLLGGIGSLLALDPAENVPLPLGGLGTYNPGDRVDFTQHAGNAWAFYSTDPTNNFLGYGDNNLGHETTPITADEAIVVTGSTHSGVVDLFGNMMVSDKPVSQLFDIHRLWSGSSGPWSINRFDKDGNAGGNYEAVLAAGNSGNPAQITYVSATTNQIVVVQEDQPEVAISAFDNTAGEPTNNGTFRITRTGSTASPLTVNFNDPTGSAIRGTDYDLVNAATGQTLSGNSVTIDAGQSYVDVDVVVRNDDIDENDEPVVLTLASGSGYTLGGTTSGTVTIGDDDTAGVTVSPTSGLVTTEAGGTASFTVRLDSQPTSSVTIGLSSNDPSEGTVLPASLTFTPGNWDQPQTVTVTGQQDTQVDDDVAYTIVTTAASSSDPKYSGLAVADVSVTNLDDDVATAPEIAIVVNGSELPDGSPFPLDFGTVQEGDGDVPLTFTVENRGDAPLNLGAVTLLNNNGFTVTSQSNAIVPAGGETTFIIALLDDTVGVKSAAVNIGNNDSDENPYNFLISGEVVAAPVGPELVVLDDSGDPEDLAVLLPETVAGEASARRTFTVRNTGDQPLVVSGLNVAGDHAADFVVTVKDDAGSVVPGDSFTVQPGVEYTLAVVFAPTGVGSRNATIDFLTNDPDDGEGDVSLALAGTGVPGQQDTAPPVIVATPLVNDGRTERNSTSVTVAFNEHVETLEPGTFVLIRAGDVTPIALDAATLDYDEATHEARLDLTALDLPDADYELHLYADGIADAAGNSLDIDHDGAGDAGTGKHETVAFFKLTGDANGDRIVTAHDMLMVRRSFNRAEGQSRFNDNADLNRDGVVNVHDLRLITGNMGSTPRPLAPAELIVEEMSGTADDRILEFGELTVGDAAVTRSFVIRNGGERALTVSAIQLMGHSSNGFAFDIVGEPAGQRSLVLAADESREVIVTFTPTTAGPVNAEVTWWHSDDAQPNPASIQLVASVAAQPLPDLIITDLRVIDPVHPNYDISYEYTVKNVGDSTADLTNVVVQTLISADQIYGKAGDIASGGRDLTIHGDTLAPGQSLTGTFGATVSFDANIHPYLVAKVDSNLVLDEADETNNTASAAIPAGTEPLLAQQQGSVNYGFFISPQAPRWRAFVPTLPRLSHVPVYLQVTEPLIADVTARFRWLGSEVLYSERFDTRHMLHLLGEHRTARATGQSK